MFNDLKEFYKYPAVITCGDEDNNLYDIEFVDFEGLVLYGKKEGEIEILASKFLQETIISYLDKGRELPQATQPRTLKVINNGYVQMFNVNMLITKKEYFSKKVKKNCSLPLWLSKLGEKEGINFSRVLENGIKKELGLIESDEDLNFL